MDDSTVNIISVSILCISVVFSQSVLQSQHLLQRNLSACYCHILVILVVVAVLDVDIVVVIVIIIVVVVVTEKLFLDEITFNF